MPDRQCTDESLIHACELEAMGDSRSRYNMPSLLVKIAECFEAIMGLCISIYVYVTYLLDSVQFMTRDTMVSIVAHSTSYCANLSAGLVTYYRIPLPLLTQTMLHPCSHPNPSCISIPA